MNVAAAIARAARQAIKQTSRVVVGAYPIIELCILMAIYGLKGHYMQIMII